MPKSKIGIAVDDELHAAVKSAAPVRGTNLEGAYDQALRSWLGNPSEATPPPFNRRSSRYKRWHDLLDFVLENGTKKQVEWLTGNLQTFEEAIRLNRSGESGPAARRARG